MITDILKIIAEDPDKHKTFYEMSERSFFEDHIGISAEMSILHRDTWTDILIHTAITLLVDDAKLLQSVMKENERILITYLEPSPLHSSIPLIFGKQSVWDYPSLSEGST
jgi:hypothetical protein